MKNPWFLFVFLSVVPFLARAQVTDTQLTSFMNCLNQIRKDSGPKPNKTQAKDYELLKAIIDSCGVQNAFVPQTGGYKDTGKVVADAAKRRAKSCDIALANGSSVSPAQNKACGGLSFLWVGQGPAQKPVAAAAKPQTPGEANHLSWKELLRLENDPRVTKEDKATRGCTRIIEDNRQRVERVCSKISSAECTGALDTALAYIRQYLSRGCPR